MDKELANIRAKFASSDKLQAYHKKKYVWKMCYIYMLGYDIDFGHVEVISLLGSTKYQEKSVGYMALSLLLKPGDQLMSLVINSMRNDLICHLSWAQALALAAISNIGGAEFSETLTPDVQRLLENYLHSRYLPPSNPTILPEVDLRNKIAVGKKVCLTLLRLYRISPERFDMSDSSIWVQHFDQLLADKDIGVLTASMSFLLGVASAQPSSFECLTEDVISILNKLVLENVGNVAPDYLYYRIPSPWLQVKCLRFLHYYKITDKKQMIMLNDVLVEILTKASAMGTEGNVNKSNAQQSILFEAINLVLTFGQSADVGLKEHAHNNLGRFLGVKDANIKYLALDTLTKLAKLEGSKAVQMHQGVVLQSLSDVDVTIRKRALECLYLLSDNTNAVEVVGELVTHLATAESVIKEEMVVKIAILAEKHSGGDFEWYVDIMLQVILLAGDFVAEAVWHRVVLIVTNHSEIHEYAAEKMLKAVEGKWIHETAVGLAGYILGEIGINICEKPGMGGFDQFAALHHHFSNCSSKVQGILLTAYVKLMNLYPDTKEYIIGEFTKCSTSSNLEIQQRACEYLALPKISSAIMEQILNTMPAYSKDKESSLLALTEIEKPTSDRSHVSVHKSGEAGVSAQKPENMKKNTSTPYNDRGLYNDNSYSDRNSLDRNSIDHDDDLYQPSIIPPKPPVHDLLSMDDEYGSPYDNMERIIKVPESMDAALKLACNNCLVALSGQGTTLYDDGVLKATWSADYRAHQGRISVNFQNLTQDPMTNVSVFTSGHESLQVKTKSPPSQINPGDEGLMQVVIDCMRPFPDLPFMEIKFETSNPYSKRSYKLPMPVSAACFFDPLPLDKATYMARWKALEADKQGEVQEVFSSNRPITPELFVSIRTKLFPALKIGVAADLDTPTTVTGCCSFRTGTAGKDGSFITVGSLLRLEGDLSQNRYRITVRSKHPLIAQAIRNVIKGQLP